MSFKARLFPKSLRSFRGQRWWNVLLRTSHLVGVSGLGAGYLYPAADQSWLLYLYITLVSGFGLVMISLYASAIWLIQLRGQVVLLKLFLLCLMPLFPAYKGWLLIAIVVLSGWISHATARVRYYSIFHGRRIDSIG